MSSLVRFDPRNRLPIQRQFISVKSKPSPKQKLDVVGKIMTTIQRICNDPMIMMLMILASYLVINHHKFAGESVITNWIKLIKDNGNANVAEFLTNNLKKLVGVLVFFPAILTVPVKFRSITIFAVGTWIWLIPESSPWQYVIQACILVFYFRLPDISDKIIIIAFGAVMWTAGYLLPAAMNVSSSNTSTPPTPVGRR